MSSPGDGLGLGMGGEEILCGSAQRLDSAVVGVIYNHLYIQDYLYGMRDGIIRKCV